MAFSQQLELNLWQDIETAKEQPEAANVKQLLQAVEAALAPLLLEQQLQVAGEAIAQLAQVFALKAELLLTQLEAKNSGDGSVLSENFLDGLMRQSMMIDLSDLMDNWQPELSQLEHQAEIEVSVAVPIAQRTARAISLAACFANATQTEKQLAHEFLSLADDERVTQSSRVIFAWMRQHSCEQAISLLRLQQVLEMPLIEVWLGLLSDQRQYEWN